jgi:lipopolysaccharide export system protein LptA
MKSFLCVLLALFAGGAFAQNAEDRVPTELKSCVGITRNTERLACFDRAVRILQGDKTVSASPESTFGLYAQEPEKKADESGESADVEAMEAKVVKLGNMADGSPYIGLDNKQGWRQLNERELLLRVGDTVKITRGALGSFQLIAPNGRSAKVRRVK